MPKQPNTHGGGSNTNKYGLLFEQTTSLNDALINAGYIIMGCNVYAGDNIFEPLGFSLPKNSLYKDFLDNKKIDYRTINSKKWLPDDAFLNLENGTLYIIEKKFQHVAGSVDEKLPNCHFKKLEYQKLMTSLDINVEFLYVFSDWFKQEQYRDTLEYIKMMGCHYFYNAIPLNFLGL